jgi:hypothetical protein
LSVVVVIVVFAISFSRIKSLHECSGEPQSFSVLCHVREIHRFGTVVCSIAAKRFQATAVDTIPLCLHFSSLAHLTSFVSPQHELRGRADAGRHLTAIGSALGGPVRVGKGEYFSAAAFTLAATLTLEASTTDISDASTARVAGSPAMWTFRTDGAFGTAAASKVIFVDANNAELTPIQVAALSTYVDWNIGAAIALGATSYVAGNMKSLSGAVTLGANAICTGSVTAANGAVTFGAGAESGNIFADGAVSMGALAKAGNVASNGLVTLGAGATTGHLTAMTVAGAADSLDTSPDGVSLGAGASAPLQIPTDLNGAEFAHGLYNSGTAITNSGTVTILVPNDYVATGRRLARAAQFVVDSGNLAPGAGASPVGMVDAQADPPHVWKFTIGAAFSTAAASKLVFKENDAGRAEITSASDSTKFKSLLAAVEFDVTGAVTIGAGSKMYAKMDSDADITLGAGAETGALKTPKSVTMGAGAKAYGSVEGTIAVTKGAGACANVAVPLDVEAIKSAIETRCPSATYANANTAGACDLSSTPTDPAAAAVHSLCCAIAADIPRWYPVAGEDVMDPTCG